MPSFGNRNRDELPSAVCGAHLSPFRGDIKRNARTEENLYVAFAADESYVAWSSGNSFVTLIPWDYFKSTLLSFSSASSPAKSSFKISVEKPDEVRHYFGPKAISIHTNYLIRCLTFCHVKSSQESSSKTFWIRRSESKTLFLASGHITGHIRLWDVFTGKLLLELLGHNTVVSDLSFCPNENMLLLSASLDGTLKVWDLVNEGDLVQNHKIFSCAVISCCWTSNKKLLVCVGMSKLGYILDVLNDSIKVKLIGHRHGIVACSLSPDGCFVATASWDTLVILWDAYSGRQLRHFCHQHPYPLPICAWNVWIKSISFSPDGSQIVTVADDGFVRFWDIFFEEDPECVGAVEGGSFCRHAPTGNIVAVGCKDGSLSFWCAYSASVRSLKFLARNAVRRSFPAEIIHQLCIPNQLVNYLKFKEL